MIEVEVLGRPHLMLADAGRDDRVVQSTAVANHLPESANGVLGQDGVVPVGKAKGFLFTPAFDLPDPLGKASGLLSRILVDQGEQSLERPTHVADDGDVGRLVLVDLGRIDVDVDDLAVTGKLADLARHAIVEAHAQGKEEVGVVNGVVGVDGTVHSQHLQAQEMLAGKPAQPHEGQRHGNAHFLREFLQKRGGSGGNDTTAGVDDGFFAGSNRV